MMILLGNQKGARYVVRYEGAGFQRHQWARQGVRLAYKGGGVEEPPPADDLLLLA